MLRTVIIAILAVAMATPAFADWEYTHWGMTAAQVIAASKGTAHPMPANRVYRDDTAKLEITVEATGKGPPRTDIGFQFDLPGGGLACVIYNATGDDADLLRTQLVQRYGPGRTSEFGPLRMLKWTTPDAVELDMDTSRRTAVVNHCAPGKS